MTAYSEESAIEQAHYIARTSAAPVLVMLLDGVYRVGHRTDKAVRSFGKHIATVHRSGLVERRCIRGNVEQEVRGNPCLCQVRTGEATPRTAWDVIV
jgi:hypothetical protein